MESKYSLVIEKAQKIKLLVSDVDGVLTKGEIFFDENGKEPLSKFNLFMNVWNGNNRLINSDCQKLGPNVCKRVRYEDLILNTKEVVKNITEFLGLSWTDEFLHHEKYVGNKIAISKIEWSTDQIKHKIYNDSLRSWEGNVDYDQKAFEKKFKMLRELGYNN
jgi:hypothetical protein